MENDQAWNYAMPPAPFSMPGLAPSLPITQPQTRTEPQSTSPTPVIPPRKSTSKDLDEHKIEMTRLYQNHSVPKIRELMGQKYGLNASLKQYKDCFNRWNMNKNIKKKEWQAILRKRSQRNNTGKVSTVRVRKQVISAPKIERYMKDHPEMDVNARIAATPSDISVYTPSVMAVDTPRTVLTPLQLSSANILSTSTYGNPSRQYGDPAPMIAETPSTLATPAPVPTNPATQHDDDDDDDDDIPMGDATPADDSLFLPSPASSISSIIHPHAGTFRGTSPDIFGSNQHDEGSGTSTALRNRRYKQDEEDDLWGEMLTAQMKYGEHHRDTVNASLDLCYLLKDQGRFKTAEGIIRHVLEEWPDEENDRDIPKLETLYLLASVLFSQGFYQKAEKIYRRIYNSRKVHLGVEHPATLNSMSALAATLSKLGNLSQAAKLQMQVIEIMKRILGEEHPITLNSINSQVATYIGLNRWDEAEKLQVRLLASGRKMSGEEHLQTLIYTSHLAIIYQNQDRLKEAEELEMQVLKIRRRVLGEEHPSTLASMNTLASAYREQGRLKEAEELEIRGIETQRRVLGEGHPDTLGSISN